MTRLLSFFNNENFPIYGTQLEQAIAQNLWHLKLSGSEVFAHAYFHQMYHSWMNFYLLRLSVVGLCMVT